MCTMTINNEKNGIELSFEGKPSEAIRTALKNLGFRWHGQKKLWYAKKSDERMALAQELSGGSDVAVSAAQPVKPATASAEVVSKYGLKVGDILFDVWGYSMTIVEYYKVTKIISPCKVEIVEIGKNVISCDRGGGETLTPDVDNEIGEKIVKQIVADRSQNGWHIKINSSISLTRWNGRPNYQNTWD